jgi:ribosomal protein S18 acetylase RimI-like enzyme
MATATAVVTRRPAQPGDEALVRALVVESRPELALLPDAVRGPILDLQVKAQRQHYDAAYPQASHEILAIAGVDVGRLILDDGQTAVRVVDVVVLQSHRGRGIATTVLRDVISDADRRGLAVELSVWSANTDARRLYERLGFVATALGERYLQMRHLAAQGGAPA